MTTHAMRIGLFTPAWPGHKTPNGIATAVYNLAMGLHEIGHQPVIIPMKEDGQGPGDIPVVPVPENTWGLWGRLRMRFGDLDAINDGFVRSITAATQTAMAEYGITAMIMEESLGWPRLIQAKTGLPVFVALHGPTALLRQYYKPDASANRYQQRNEGREAQAFANAPGLMSPSRHVLDGVAQLAPIDGVPQAVLANSFAAPRPDPLPAGLSPRKILFVGRFDYLKGCDTVLEAMAHLVRTHPEAELTFAGPDKGLERPDGRMLSFPEALAELAGDAQDRITYFGPASRDEVAALRASHAIALISSRYENLNYSLLEAMAAGQAIVSTAVGGPKEVLKNGETALLVPPADPAAMASALGRLLDDAALTQALGAEAVETVQRDFNPAKIAADTVAFMQNVLGEGGA